MTLATLPTQPQAALPATHRGPISHAEAIALTAEIRANANRLWMLVALAHDRKAWKALGYDTWRSYVHAELGLSESRSYQLVDTGRVMLAIADAAGVTPDALDPVPARTVAKVKDALPTLRRAVRTAIDDAAGTDELLELTAVIDLAIDRALAALRPEPDATAVRVLPVPCPVCDGAGQLGRGRQARELADKASRWLARQR